MNMHFKTTETATQYYNRVLHVLVDSGGSLILGWIIELLYVLIKAVFLILTVTAIPLQQAALLHILQNYPVRHRKSRAPHRPDLQQGYTYESTDSTRGATRADSSSRWLWTSGQPTNSSQSITKTIPVQPKAPRKAPVTDQGLINSKDSQLYWLDLQPPPFSPFPKSLFSLSLPAQMGQSHWATH